MTAVNTLNFLAPNADNAGMFKMSSPVGEPPSAPALNSLSPEALAVALNEAASRLAQLGACARSAEIEIGFFPAVSGELAPRLERICEEAQALVTLLARAQAALAMGDEQSPADVEPPARERSSKCGPYSFATRAREEANGCSSPAAIRLLATQLAEAGLGRGDIETRLRTDFGIADPGRYVPDLLAKVAN